MSKINELIQQLCPNGVEFKELKEFAIIGTGNRNGNEGIENGEFPLYVRSKYIKSIDSYDFDEEAIIIPGEGGVGEIFHYINGKYALHQRAYRISFRKDNILTKYVYYYMQSNFKSFIYRIAVSATVTSIRKPMIEKFSIPIPPIQVQQEIVKILDQFTALDQELNNELQARKQQYSFYLNQLLRFEENKVEWKTLGDLCKIGDGLHGTPKYDINGEYYFINGNNLNNRKIELNSNTNKVSFETFNKLKIDFNKNNTVFLSLNGTIGNVSLYDDEKIVLGKSVGYFNIISPKIYNKYLFYILQTSFSKNYFEKNKTGSTIKNLGLKALRQYKIPVPSLEEQERIVKILDQFDALVNDTTVGLPAEINARKQQYEYYRNQLLTFKPLD